MSRVFFDELSIPSPDRQLGVGSGLLLSQIAPNCAEYWGTDFSAPTIRRLQAAVAAQSWGDRVRLQVQPADVAEGLPEGHFDVVVLNSVVQYFPSADYLRDVMAVAMPCRSMTSSARSGDHSGNPEAMVALRPAALAASLKAAGTA